LVDNTPIFVRKAGMA